jgi:hypothetical protein
MGFSNRSYSLMLLAVIVSMLFHACEEVIDLDLSNAGPVLVIEGGVSNISENQLVRISKTVPFDKSNSFNAFSGAVVTLTTASGQQIPYTEVSPGVYQTARFRGTPGNKYTLDVIAEGKTYTASSIMPQPVRLDSLTTKRFSLFGDTSLYVAVNYLDPPFFQNQYRYVLKVKGKVEYETVAEDRFFNGNRIADILFYKLNDLNSGDRIEADLQCIDRPVFKYFFAINQITGEGGPPVAPANPVSNFNNGALGVFSAYTSSKVVNLIK